MFFQIVPHPVLRIRIKNTNTPTFYKVDIGFKWVSLIQMYFLSSRVYFRFRSIFVCIGMYSDW